MAYILHCTYIFLRKTFFLFSPLWDPQALFSNYTTQTSYLNSKAYYQLFFFFLATPGHLAADSASH